MNTWLYPGWTQGSDNEKIREGSECNDRSLDTDTDQEGSS